MRKLLVKGILVILFEAIYLNWNKIFKNHDLSVYKSFLSYIIFALIVLFIKDTISIYYRKRNKLGINDKNNVVVGIENISNLILTIVFIFFLLSFWNIDPKTLFTSLSIVAAAIAIVFKDYISPIISGFIMAFSSDLNIGDNVKIGLHKGIIKDIKMSKLALQTDDDDIIFIPNDKVYLSEIMNYTTLEVKRVSIPFSLPSTSVKSVVDLENELINELAEYQNYINKDSFNLKVVNIFKDNIEFKFQYSMAQRNPELEKNIRKKTARKIIDYITSSMGKSNKNDSSNAIESIGEPVE
jgi:small-conductance mechanosensitive channel